MTRVFSHLYVFRVYNDHSNNFTDSIFIGEVFQIEVSDVVDLVHPLEIMKKSPWRQLECLRGNACSVFYMRLKFQIITPTSVQNSISIGEVFQIEVSDGIAQPLGSHQKVNLYPAKVFTGA